MIVHPQVRRPSAVVNSLRRWKTPSSPEFKPRTARNTERKRKKRGQKRGQSRILHYFHSQRRRKELAAYPAVPICKWLAIHAQVMVVSVRNTSAISSFLRSALRRLANSASSHPRRLNSSRNNRSAFAVAVSARSQPPYCLLIRSCICSNNSARNFLSPKNQPRRNCFYRSGLPSHRRCSICRSKYLRPTALSLGIFISPSSRSTRTH